MRDNTEYSKSEQLTAMLTILNVYLCQFQIKCHILYHSYSNTSAGSMVRNIRKCVYKLQSATANIRVSNSFLYFDEIDKTDEMDKIVNVHIRI